MRQAQKFCGENHLSYTITVNFQQLNCCEVLTRESGSEQRHRKGCHVMQVGPMWQANGNQYATKWQVSHCPVSSHSTAVVHPDCAGFHAAHPANKQCLH